MTQSFIEKQFPVSKVSKESYKERKSSQGQTITGLGKWWGRKPLVLVRAAIIGCLMPTSDYPDKDMEVFLKVMSMDNVGLLLRKEKQFHAEELYRIIRKHRKLFHQFGSWFDNTMGKMKLRKGAPRDDMEAAAFQTLSYDEKIAMCMRPEQLESLADQTWDEINQHLDTTAHSLSELINQLSVKQFGRNVIVGDCFCGGGSIPFEAARIGCGSYASDLNPIAGLLTWASLHICGANQSELERITAFQKAVYEAVDKEISGLGIEHNELGDRALSYLYCVEADCPECGWLVPLLPTLVVGIRAGLVVAKLKNNGHGFDIDIISKASEKMLKEAQRNGTVRSNALFCPHCNKSTPISSLRRDRIDKDGNTISGLRQWGQDEFKPHDDDVYQERLYAIRYEHLETRADGRVVSTRYYRSPSERDLENETKVCDTVEKNIAVWQSMGLIPSSEIEMGDKTDEVRKNRGWTQWHHLFNARQLFVLSRFVKYIKEASTTIEKATGLLGLNKCIDFNSKLCRWNPNRDIVAQTFYNQALNTLNNYATSGLTMLHTPWAFNLNKIEITDTFKVALTDARSVNFICDLWITDPPYADAVNYHELSEFFLAWDKTLLKEAFPDWYTDSKRILAVRGDEHFSQTMIEIYSNLTQHMGDDGMQIVMFTHSDPAVWAQLALIMWKAGLTVTAAWNIATETDASGLKDGNYVKGTVLLILRKQQGNTEAFLDELAASIKQEVRTQIESMQLLEDKEDPNFSDPDYVLAAYAASLKVLTSCKSIGEIDLDRELDLAIHDPSKSEVVKLIERAKKIAYDFIIPLEFDNFLWKMLSPAERFYIKGLEAEKHGNNQISTYQEYARGFGLASYGQLMGNERANTARLKTPGEFAMRTVNDVPGFEKSTLRLVLAAIHVASTENDNPLKGLSHIKNELPDYWGNRDMLKQLLFFLKDAQDIDTMPHWYENARMAEHIYVLVDNDHV